MPDWQPVVAPDLCPRCGAYWECEHTSPPPDERSFYERMAPQITQRVMEERKLDQQFIPEMPPLGPENPIFVRFLREVRDTAIAGGEIDLAKDIDKHIPDTFDFTKLDSLGLARAGDAP